MRKIAIAMMTVSCATLLTIDCSQPTMVSIQSAQARFGRPLTPISGAGMARRHYRRSVGVGVVGAGVAAGVAAGAIGAGVAAATSPWGYPSTGYYGYGGGAYYGGGYGYGTSPYYGGGAYPSYPAYGGGYYSHRSYVTGRPTLLPRYYGGPQWW